MCLGNVYLTSMHKLSCYLCIQVRHFVDSSFCCVHSVDMFALDPCHVNVCGRTLLVLLGLGADHVTISRRSRHVTRPTSGSTVIISRRITVQDNLFEPKWLFEVSAHKKRERERIMSTVWRIHILRLLRSLSQKPFFISPSVSIYSKLWTW